MSKFASTRRALGVLKFDRISCPLKPSIGFSDQIKFDEALERDLCVGFGDSKRFGNFPRRKKSRLNLN